MTDKTQTTERTPVVRNGDQGSLLDTPWQPFGGFERLLDEVASGWPWAPHRHRRHGGMGAPFASLTSGWNGMPAVDVVDTETEVQIRAELPGMDESDVDVRVSDGMLTIVGEKKEEKEEGEKEGNYYVSERRYGTFQRSFRIPAGTDLENIAAQYRKGVLTVTLPKTSEAREKTRKIEVKGES